MTGNPDFYRWMLFVDGENFAIQAKKIAFSLEVDLKPGPHYQPDEFCWLPTARAVDPLYAGGGLNVYGNAIRSYYYTACQGTEDKIAGIKRGLRNLGFYPEVFKKHKTKSKGVDITLTKDLLSHAFLGNFQIAVLIAGDSDYIPLIQQVQRLGKVVHVAFFTGENSGLHEDLIIAADGFYDMNPKFRKYWNRTP
jgi:hypothetical protein